MKSYYTDKQTNKFLNSKHARVYIYGSNAGFMNFGDIVQLKGALWFWRQHTQIEPVIVFSIKSIEDSDYIKRTMEWYDCDHIIYYSEEPVDAADCGLEPVTSIQAGGLLHIYGGGFFNGYWGKGVIATINDLFETFEISDYIISGQQVEDVIVSALDENLFSKKKPLLFGVRDRDSLRHMKNSTIRNDCYFSFDDVADIFRAWKQSAQPSRKARLLNTMKKRGILLHLNVSYYSNNKLQVQRKIAAVRKKYPHNRPTVVQAFNEMRINTLDSLQSLALLEHTFPYDEYKVVNFANFALKMHPERGHYPNVGNVLNGIKFTVSSSYHTAMLSSYFGIPTYLVSSNNYYSQKQRALRLESDFQKFLDDPSKSVNDFKKEYEEREVWIDKFLKVAKEAQLKVTLRPKKLRRSAPAKGLPKPAYKTPNS